MSQTEHQNRHTFAVTIETPVNITRHGASVLLEQCLRMSQTGARSVYETHKNEMDAGEAMGARIVIDSKFTVEKLP